MDKLCDNITKQKCDSFYKEAFINRTEYINQLQQEIQQLKEQIKENKNDLEDMFQQKQMMFENMQQNQLKCCELAKQLKQRDEVIDEAIEFLKTYHKYENRFKWCELDYIDTIEKLEDILNKYKGVDD